MSLRDLLNQTGTFRRVTPRTPDGRGGWIEGSAVALSIPVRVDALTAKERLAHPSQDALVSHVLYAASAPDVKRDDTVTVGSRSYEVVAIRAASVPEHHVEIDLKEFQRGR